MIETNPSPIQDIEFRGIFCRLKRDDLLSREFSGNKARKFYYYLNYDFNGIKRVISHGSAQSNAMYSLSVLAKFKRVEFVYYVTHIASYLAKNPHGNYKYALENGMTTIEGSPPKEFKDDELFIPEGGAIKEAREGIKLLADELKDEDGDIFLPSGTGTTALFLQSYLKRKVYTCACVGNSSYLKSQFFKLQKDDSLHPIILSVKKKYHFGKLYRDFFEIWVELKRETSIEFDLLYDPLGWINILKHRALFQDGFIYIHQGGILGNESMIRRYKRKFSADNRE